MRDLRQRPAAGRSCNFGAVGHPHGWGLLLCALYQRNQGSTGLDLCRILRRRGLGTHAPEGRGGSVNGEACQNDRRSEDQPVHTRQLLAARENPGGAGTFRTMLRAIVDASTVGGVPWLGRAPTRPVGKILAKYPGDILDSSLAQRIAPDAVSASRRSRLESAGVRQHLPPRGTLARRLQIPDSGLIFY